jgi:DNA-binding transcriptional MerR regulator
MDRVPRTHGKYQSQADQRYNLTIGQLSQLTGINTKAIRYYEGAGLLPCPPRGANHYRRYSMADVNRLLLLRRIRLLGVPLSAARTLLIGASDARCIDIQQELLALVDERLKFLDQEIANLQQFRVALANYQRALAACQPGENEPFSTCPDMECIDFTTASCS